MSADIGMALYRIMATFGTVFDTGTSERKGRLFAHRP